MNFKLTSKNYYLVIDKEFTPKIQILLHKL
jgi:hypothetical protein